MRRALASCPDADRTEALPLSSLECSPAELLALELRVQQACQERGGEPGAYVVGRRGGVVKRESVPPDRAPSRIRRR